MKKRRRIEQLLGMVFLSAGASLLLYVSVSLFQSHQEPQFLDRSPQAGPILRDLPPALAPAPQTAAQNHASVPQLSAGSDNAPLLPESPLVDEQAPVEHADAADPAPAAAAAAAAATSGPRRIIIPALAIDAPVHPAGLETKQDGQRTYLQWSVPDAYAAGWHESSAPLGQPGNTVLNGHNNVHGAIFSELLRLPVGEQIILAGDEGVAVYRVTHHELLQEHGATLRQRLHNARWIASTADERLTLVTCWPNTTNSHRLIIVAEPVGDMQALALPPLTERRIFHES